MPRMEVELTSTREDGDWTWRAAGARQPKGSVQADLVPGGSSVGDILRVEFEQFMDGIEVTSVLPGKDERQAPELIEMLGSGRDEPLVTTRLTGKRGRRRDDDEPSRGRDRRGGRGGDRRRDERRGKGRQSGPQSKEGDRRPRSRGDGRPGGREERSTDRKRSERRPRNRPATETGKATPKRLRPRRTHRKAALAALPEDQQLLAQILLRDGIPGVRTAIEVQNKAAESIGEPPIPAPLLHNLAQRIHPTLRTPDW
ncbi:MAG: hypothetical protein MK196_11670, partial [Acidimicrobiales bacterium]|nr:hypothetical protein [Acidimicrobiales bacterium]